MKKTLLFAVAAISLFGSPANAQTTKAAEERYSYHFEDDDLLGSSLDASGDIIRIRIGPIRTLLIRPRVSFVTEIRKTAEAF